MHRVRVPSLVAVAMLAGAACSPPSSDGAGLDRLSTDLVLGAQTRSTLPPPTPGAELAPAFPSFFVSSPPPAPPPAATPSYAANTTVPPPKPVACRQASASVVPPPAPTEITTGPVPGVYQYRQSGSYSVGNRFGKLPASSDHVVSNVTRDASTGTISYDVAVDELGVVTTTSYSIVRAPGGSSASNGLYVTHIVMKAAGQTNEFQPAPPGLRIFAMPAVIATSWTSVATDPIHGTSATLDGVITSPSRVDACGDLIEGWETKSTISITTVATPEVVRSTKIVSTSVVLPQLGGLVGAAHVLLTGSDGGVEVRQESDATIDTLAPKGPAKR